MLLSKVPKSLWLTCLGVFVGFSTLDSRVAAADGLQDYRYDCHLRLAVRDGYAYVYHLAAVTAYDAERRVVAEVREADLTLDLVGPDARRIERYLESQPLAVASKTERSLVLDYENAVYSLNARLSLVDGPEKAFAKVYHKYAEDVRVASTQQMACTAMRLN